MEDRCFLSEASDFELVALSQRRDAAKNAALTELLSRNESLIQRFCSDCYTSPNDRDDALQGGRIGLLESVMLYRPDMNATLLTYAFPRIRERSKREASKGHRPLETLEAEPIALEGEHPSALDDFSSVRPWGIGALSDAMNTLDEKKRRLIYLRVGKEMSFTEIALLEGTSASAIRQRFLTALKGLRNLLESTNCETAA